jgi:hypothetical protein
MRGTECSDEQLNFWDLGKQTVTVDFHGGAIVSDAGLLTVRRLDRQLGVLKEAARRLPDPRSQPFVTHTSERILTQRVYQILGGYFDGNDAQVLRHDPLFQTLCDVPPSDDQPLASGSTLNHFQHAYTRREAEKPPEEREVIFEQRAAHLNRIKEMNRYLVELFIKTRHQPPERIVLDIDATDDPTHGAQQLSLLGGYHEPYEYKPLLVTNIKDSPQAIYHGFYVQRGDVPERSIGELKNGLAIGRLSSHMFLAHAFTM